MISRLVGSVDGVRHIALVLTVFPPSGEEAPVGIGHLMRDPDDPHTADAAITVADGWQGRGVGTALGAALLRQRPAGVTRLRTVVGADNQAALALLARAGRMTASQPHLGTVEITVELPPPGCVGAASPGR